MNTTHDELRDSVGEAFRVLSRMPVDTTAVGMKRQQAFRELRATFRMLLDRLEQLEGMQGHGHGNGDAQANPQTPTAQ